MTEETVIKVLDKLNLIYFKKDNNFDEGFEFYLHHRGEYKGIYLGEYPIWQSGKHVKKSYKSLLEFCENRYVEYINKLYLTIK